MVPCSFEESDCVMSAPPGMEEAVDPLSVVMGTMEGVPMVVSCWKPTREELDEITRTGRVWLMILGDTMPPVYLQGYKPNFVEGDRPGV